MHLPLLSAGLPAREHAPLLCLPFGCDSRQKIERNSRKRDRDTQRRLNRHQAPHAPESKMNPER
jgi:hypothetical protein